MVVTAAVTMIAPFTERLLFLLTCWSSLHVEEFNSGSDDFVFPSNYQVQRMRPPQERTGIPMMGRRDPKLTQPELLAS